MRPVIQRRHLFVLGFAMAALAAVFFGVQRHRDAHDPVVHGRRLSQWVMSLDSSPYDSSTTSGPFGGLVLSMPAIDYLRERPQLAAVQIVAYLETRHSRTRKAYGWCKQHLPRPLFNALPRPWVCWSPHRVVKNLSSAPFEREPLLRAEWESLCQDPDGTLQRMAYHALFETGFYPRGYYTNWTDGAPILADGLQHTSPDIQKIVLEVIAEIVANHQAARWPASLPPLAPLLEHLATGSANLATRFEADGILRTLDPKRPALSSSRPSQPAGPSVETKSLLDYPFASPPAGFPSSRDLSSPPRLYESTRY